MSFEIDVELDYGGALRYRVTFVGCEVNRIEVDGSGSRRCDLSDGNWLPIAFPGICCGRGRFLVGGIGLPDGGVVTIATGLHQWDGNREVDFGAVKDNGFDRDREGRIRGQQGCSEARKSDDVSLEKNAFDFPPLFTLQGRSTGPFFSLKRLICHAYLIKIIFCRIFNLLSAQSSKNKS